MNLLFIHIPKTGGSSLDFYFSRKATIPLTYEGILFSIHPKDFVDGIPPQHFTHEYIRKNIPLDYDQTTIMTVVRNPYDRVISELLWRGFINKELSPNQIEQEIQKYLESPNIYEGHRIPAHKFLEINGEIDSRIKILRTESLTEDMHNLGFTDFDECTNVTYRNKLDYQTLLTEPAKQRIYEYYKKDFEIFGYQP